MWTLIKGWSFWIAALAVVSFVGGVYLIAHGMGYDKGLAVGIDRLEAHYQQYAELAAKEQERQIEFITIREPIITERIVYIEKEREEYEAEIASNPSPVECRMPPSRVRQYNSIGQKAPD